MTQWLQCLHATPNVHMYLPCSEDPYSPRCPMCLLMRRQRILNCQLPAASQAALMTCHHKRRQQITKLPCTSLCEPAQLQHSLQHNPLSRGQPHPLSPRSSSVPWAPTSPDATGSNLQPPQSPRISAPQCPHQLYSHLLQPMLRQLPKSSSSSLIQPRPSGLMHSPMHLALLAPHQPSPQTLRRLLYSQHRPPMQSLNMPACTCLHQAWLCLHMQHRPSPQRPMMA